jgi:hypothetical protein
MKKIRVDYHLLQVGELPVFGRPDKGMPPLRQWRPTLSQWKRVIPPRLGRPNFVLELVDLDGPLFTPYLERAASGLPPKDGAIVVVLGSFGTDPPFFHFGLMYVQDEYRPTAWARVDSFDRLRTRASLPKTNWSSYGGLPPKTMAMSCPLTVSV